MNGIKSLHEKACCANNVGFRVFVSHCTHAIKNGLCSSAMIMTNEKKNVKESPKAHATPYVQLAVDKSSEAT